MNLLDAKLYDPAVAVTKATSALLAMTAFDTVNLRLAVVVPAHGFVRFRIVATVTGATTMPVIYLGVLNGSTVVARCTPTDFPGTASAATQTAPAMIEVVVGGLTPGLTNFDAAYGVEVVVAATAIKYGGPNNAVTNDAWGALQFEAWDPRPTPTAAPGAAGGLFIAGSNAATTVNFTGNLSGSVGSVTGSVASVTGAVGSVTGAVGSVTAAVTLPAIPNNWITSAGITAAALNGKGDWLLASGYTAPDNAGISTLTGRLTAGRATALDNLDAAVSTRLASAGYTAPPAAAVNATAVRTELAAELGRIDVATSTRLAAAGYTAPNNALLATVATYVDTEVAAIKGVVDKLDTAIELDGAVYRFTANALELGPLGSGGGGGLDAAGVRAAIGLASANLDTQLAGLSTFDAATDTVLADVRLVNSTLVAGSGTPGNPWGPA